MSDKVDKYLLEQHVKKQCLNNLRDRDNSYCGQCPFEEIIVAEFPFLKESFVTKRARKLNSCDLNGTCN